jgi:hypothetical protein
VIQEVSIMVSIQRVGAADATYASQPERSVVRARSREESTQSSLTLKVRTAEGDTVELSLDASSVRQGTSGFVQNAAGSASYSSVSQSDSVNFQATIKGDLNDQEMSDVVSLIHSLGNGEPSTSSLSTLSAYAGALTRTSSAGSSMVRLYA